MNDEIEQIVPPKGISDEDFEQCKHDLKRLDSYLSTIENLCFEYANCKSMLGEDNEEDDKYYQARMTVALHEITHNKSMVMGTYKRKFPGFSRRIIDEIIVDEIEQFSGVNEELLGPAEKE